MHPDLAQTLQAALGDSYSIERELGGGGMSRVFLARETTLGRSVVIKVLPPETAADVSGARFRREVLVAANLQHPLVVPLLSAGEAEHLLYFTMPFVDGESLRTRLDRQGELPVEEAVQVLRDVLSALSHAHARGIVHRDIKPANVLLSGGHALVADFGVARAIAGSLAGAGDGTTTAAGLALGTPAYMAPEQAAADPQADHRVDLYAAGVLAYEAMTGSHPFAGRTAQGMMAAHATEMPEDVRRRRPTVPPAVAALVMRLLQKRPSDRPQDAGEALRELVAAMRGSSAGSVGSRARLVAIAAVLLVLVGGAAMWAAVGRGGDRAASTAQASDAGTSVAVMPFENLGGTADDEHFSDGLTEELIGALGRVQGLQVAARTSVFALKGQPLALRAIGDTLGVRTVVSGSLRRVGERLRVAVRLEDVRTGQLIWSERYDREMGDVFAMQDEISRTVAARLAGELSPRGADEPMPRPANLEAYDLVLRARYALHHRRVNQQADFREAGELFDRALTLDPAYAPAAAGLAEAYTLLTIYGYVPMREGYARARSAAERALALDPTLAEAYTSYGFVLAAVGEYDASESALQRAIALRPSDALAHHYYSLLLIMLARYDEAAAENARALQLDPLSLPAHSTRSTLFLVARDYGGAQRTLDHALQLNSGFPLALYFSGLVRIVQGAPDDAIPLLEQALRRAPAFPGVHAAQRLAYEATGRPADAQRVLAELRQRGEQGRGAFELALARAYAGDLDEGFRLLGAASWDVPEVIHLRSDPLLDGLRADPRYAALLAGRGLR